MPTKTRAADVALPAHAILRARATAAGPLIAPGIVYGHTRHERAQPVLAAGFAPFSRLEVGRGPDHRCFGRSAGLPALRSAGPGQAQKPIQGIRLGQHRRQPEYFARPGRRAGEHPRGELNTVDYSLGFDYSPVPRVTLRAEGKQFVDQKSAYVQDKTPRRTNTAVTVLLGLTF